MTMKRILVPTDFSPHARNAARYAGGFFTGEPVRFQLLHAFNLPLRTTELMLSSLQDTLDAEAREQLQLEMQHLKAEQHHPDTLFETTAVFGDAVHVISNIAHQQHVDFIVMGTRGASGLKAILVGSTTSAVIRRVKCPVLAIPEVARYKKPNHILLAIDPLAPLPQHIDLVRKLASGVNALLSVLSIVEEKSSVSEEDHRKSVDALLKGMEYSFTILHDTGVATGIDHFLTNNSVDLLVLFPGKGTFPDRVFHPSVTKKMALHTHVPLLTLRIGSGE